MKTIKAGFNMDTGCVELRQATFSRLHRLCRGFARFQRRSWTIISNDPLAYADLVLNGDVDI